jgi:hypothetical protein
VESEVGALTNELIYRAKMVGSDRGKSIKMCRKIMSQAGRGISEQVPARLSCSDLATDPVEPGAPAVKGFTRVRRREIGIAGVK